MSAQPALLDVADTQPEITHGAAQYVLPRGAKRGQWHVAAKPYVMILLKRVFPRVQTTSGAVVVIAHSPATASELAWFMQRYDLVLSAADRAFLETEANRHLRTEQQTQSILAGRPIDGTAFRTMSDQQMREYQRIAADLIAANKRVLVTDELGLGKTLTGLATLRAPDALPAVIVAPTHLTKQWQRYLSRVWPDLTSHIAKTANPKTDKRKADPDVLILNYAKLAGWRYHLAGEARSVIFDEAQDLRRGEASEKGMAAAHISDEATYAVGLTNTPVYNYGDEIHSVIQILRRDALGTREEFLREWGGQKDIGLGKHSTVKDPAALGEYLRDRGLMIGRTRREVGRELPYGEPIPIAHTIPADTAVLDRMTGNAVEMARLILSKSTDRQERFQASGELDSMMRQATGIAKAPFVAAFVAGLLESERKVVLWGWHHAVYDLWEEHLHKAGITTARFTGQESQRQKDLALARFTGKPEQWGITRADFEGLPYNHPNRSHARVLIMSLRSGAGIDGLQETCSVGVFGELDWSPQIHHQCLGRLARDGQENEVLGYYLMAEHGADPEIAEALQVKHAQSAPIVDPTKVGVKVLPANDGQRIRALARSILTQAGEVLPEAEPDTERPTLT